MSACRSIRPKGIEMSDAGFEKVSASDKPMYGPRKLLICGFASEVQPNFVKLLEIIGLTDMPKIWVTEANAGNLISEVLALEDNTGWGVSSELPRAIIMCGLTQNELHLLMSGSRQAGMKPPLWASLTPTSETWTVQDLLKELVAEHQAMQQRNS
jgi:hypothetical protein